MVALLDGANASMLRLVPLVGAMVVLMDGPIAAERGGVTLVLVTGPPASGKTSLAQPLARHLGLPLLGKDTSRRCCSTASAQATEPGRGGWERPVRRCCWSWPGAARCRA